MVFNQISLSHGDPTALFLAGFDSSSFRAVSCPFSGHLIFHADDLGPPLSYSQESLGVRTVNNKGGAPKAPVIWNHSTHSGQK